MAAHLLALYGEPTDPTHFEQYYHGTHVPLVKAMPGLRSFALSKGAISSQGGVPYYFVADLAFDSMDALRAALASPQGEATVADVPQFASGGVTLVMFESTEV